MCSALLLVQTFLTRTLAQVAAGAFRLDVVSVTCEDARSAMRVTSVRCPASEDLHWKESNTGWRRTARDRRRGFVNVIDKVCVSSLTSVG